MARRKYMSPLLLTITPGDESTPIIIGNSQATIGDEDPYNFDLESFAEAMGDDAQDYIDMIISMCDDIQFQEMDTNGNLIITYGEFAAWNEVNGLFP